MDVQPTREQRSLFGEILDWMLAPLLLLWPMSVALTWLVAQSIASRPFDRDLAEMARTVARQVVVVPGSSEQPTRIKLRLPEVATEVLRDRGRIAAHRLHPEVVRYCGWPAQATAYKLGERAWLAKPDLRELWVPANRLKEILARYPNAVVLSRESSAVDRRVIEPVCQCSSWRPVISTIG